ncbi:hypothetical protein [Nodosilinea sp. E11]|uniref:hypothetical protein n=1 Tax=Nodosilinea sp. E11 TaxID=3037479 RepID=UPI002934132E|nr:hypothetical protein [Nodosilinea sp. E11]WOD40933.1 hypothetical protein RRF56_09020 [Nodosilinea sp. E11]
MLREAYEGEILGALLREAYEGEILGALLREAYEGEILGALLREACEGEILGALLRECTLRLAEFAADPGREVIRILGALLRPRLRWSKTGP